MHGHQTVDGSSVLAGGACSWWAWLWAGEAGLLHWGTSAISFRLFSWADEILPRRLVQSSAWRRNICLPSFWGSSWEEAEGFKLWDQTCVLFSCCQYGPWCPPRQRPSISSSPENKSAPLLWVVGRAVTWLQGCRRYLEYLAASQTDIRSVLVGVFSPLPTSQGPGGCQLLRFGAGGRGLCFSTFPTTSLDFSPGTVITHTVCWLPRLCCCSLLSCSFERLHVFLKNPFTVTLVWFGEEETLNTCVQPTIFF